MTSLIQVNKIKEQRISFKKEENNDLLNSLICKPNSTTSSSSTNDNHKLHLKKNGDKNINTTNNNNNSKRAILRKAMWNAWKQAQKPKPKAKEIKECLAFFSRTERFFKKKKLIIDCCGGHGALGLAFKVHNRNDVKVLIGDLHCPESFYSLRKKWLPLTKNNNTDNRNSKQTKNDVVNHIKIDLRKVGWLSKILKSENMTHLKDVACVGCHVCNALTDKMIEECLSTNVEFAVCGCCHGSISKQGRSMKQSAKELGVPLGLFVDTTRFGMIANRKGFIAKLRTIDKKITPENRILIGIYDTDTLTSEEHSSIALNKVAKVYERVFKDL